MANSRHICHLVHAQMAADLVEAAEHCWQAEVKKRKQAAEAAYKGYELRIKASSSFCSGLQPFVRQPLN